MSMCVYVCVTVCGCVGFYIMTIHYFLSALDCGGDVKCSCLYFLKMGDGNLELEI